MPIGSSAAKRQSQSPSRSASPSTSTASARRSAPSASTGSPRLRSTNDHAAVTAPARRAVRAGGRADRRQTAGRGRGRNAWWSGRGCLTVTFVLPVDEQLAAAPDPAARRPGGAQRGGGADAATTRSQLKWPNDLLYDGRKLAGLLCERMRQGGPRRPRAERQPRPRDGAAGAARAGRRRCPQIARQAARHDRRAGDRRRRTCTALLSRRAEQPFAAVLQEYDAHHALVGRTVTVTSTAPSAPVSGRCEGLDDMGRLLLRSRGKLHRVISGQVTLVGVRPLVPSPGTPGEG